MTYRHIGLLLFCSIVAVVLSSGCIEDKCSAVHCQNEGVCVRGTCACTFGYEGNFCENQWYQKFEGAWQATETDKNGQVLRKYDVTVIYAGSPDTFTLLNFADTVDTVVCVREAYRSFRILEKQVNDSFKVLSMEGTISDDGSKVTGLYSLSQKDVITSTGYSWTR